MRVIVGEPMDHVSFVYDLIEATRPRLVVDVGVGTGLSFAVACQSMRDHDVDGLVYGIDSWEDDEQKSEVDSTRWASLNTVLHRHFRGVGYLMKMTCTEALPHFAEGSIDVVRLNPARAAVPLGSLIDSWTPRLARGGVLLCHGVSDRERPDVGEDWKRCIGARTGFVFTHGTGLGVFRTTPKDDEPASPLLRLLTSEHADDREGLARFYEHADRHHSIRVEVHSAWTSVGGRKR